MKATKYALVLSVGLLCLTFPGPLRADTLLYDNGAVNNTGGGYRPGMYAVSDSFTASADSILTIAALGLIVHPGDLPNTVQWSIGTTRYGSDVASGTGSFLNQIDEGPVVASYPGETWLSTVDISGTVMVGTTYYLTLGEATSVNNSTVFWITTNGPSTAYFLASGTQPVSSNSFQIYGTRTPVPETSSLLLLGTGLLVLMGLWLSKKLPS